MKKNAVILGATGAAGQNIVEFAWDHPWFELGCLGASERSHGLNYKEAIRGAVFFGDEPGEEVLNMKVQDINRLDPRDFDIAFSALPSEVARVVEARFAEHIPVVSTASAYRYEPDVPILLPEVNPEHLHLVEAQRENRGWDGYVVPGPNCTTVGLVMTLKPIHDRFGVESVSMVSLQALSGAGEKGLRFDSPYRRSVEMNVLPLIEGEEEKVAHETNKILGALNEGGVEPASINVHATCTRVYVETVHTEAVHLGASRHVTVKEVREALEDFRSEPQTLRLPMAPEQPIHVVDDEYGPQPRVHGSYPDMVTLVGRLRENRLFRNGLSYVLTSDNLERGAGGGAMLTAELLLRKGYV
ncbi:MAG: aspartate-semialdehyde dehydrogenase [Candidatus Bathyarchaeota archaeon]